MDDDCRCRCKHRQDTDECNVFTSQRGKLANSHNLHCSEYRITSEEFSILSVYLSCQLNVILLYVCTVPACRKENISQHQH